MKKLLLTTGAAIFAMSTTASAALLSISGGTAGTIPGASEANEIVDNLTGSPTLGGFFGGSISVDEKTALKIEFLGFEAGFTNTFRYLSKFVSDDYEGVDGDLGNNQALPTDFAGVFPTFFVMDDGLLDFSFETNGSVADPDVSNGDANANIAGNANFFASFGDDSTTAGTELTLWFDDGGASGDDDNHDDMVIRISIAPDGGPIVPLPGAAIPLLTALGGLGIVGARRRKKASA